MNTPQLISGGTCENAHVPHFCESAPYDVSAPLRHEGGSVRCHRDSTPLLQEDANVPRLCVNAPPRDSIFPSHVDESVPLLLDENDGACLSRDT